MFDHSLVSVIVTCFNQGMYLGDALNSILDQTYKEWECIIIDDGSTDNTKDIALSFCKKNNKFKYYHQLNSGVSSARNFGLSKISGAYVQFLDADDFISSNKIAYQINVLQKNDLIDVIYGSSRFFEGDNKEVMYPFHYHFGGIPCDLNYKDGFQVDMLIKGNICTNCAPLFRRKIFDKVKFRNVIYEDWILNIECALNSFIFSFDNDYASYSYIRMSDSSQMLRHTAKNANKNQASATCKSLLQQYNYQLSPQLLPVEKSGKNKRLLETINNAVARLIRKR